MIQCDSYSTAFNNANNIVFAQPDYIYHIDTQADGCINIGGSDAVQVMIIDSDYIPENGWEAWADDYYPISVEDAMNMSAADTFNL